MRLSLLVACCFALFGIIPFGPLSLTWAQTLQDQLLQTPAAELATEARDQGDAQRGAILFFHPQSQCAQCHAADDAALADGILRVGPEMVSIPPALTDEAIVQAILEPSASLREGFATVAIETDDGQLIVGRLLEQTEETVTVLPPATENPIRIPVEQVVAISKDQPSMMPVGLVNQFSGRQAFYDLVKYLIEIRDLGPDRARELRPSPSLYAVVLPEYESHVDHAGLLESLNDESFERGAEIYHRLCINCHGDHENPGSLPTAPRFGESPLRNGADPLSMYRTLTHGFGFMVAQSWMVPKQKYDVIHYIREEYFRERSDDLYVAIDSTYLNALPKGDTFGPEPVEVRPWAEMDYGPALINTYELPLLATSGNPHLVYKGIAVRLDAGAGGVARGRAWMVFDHDLMSWAGAWTATEDQPRFINWNGIHFDGSHGTHPRTTGTTHFSVPHVPGWADPESQSIVDNQRVIGRDNRLYGPLPRSWARYRGLYACGERSVVEYEVGQTLIREMPGLVELATSGSGDAKSDLSIFTRAVNLGAAPQSLRMVVSVEGSGAQLEMKESIAIVDRAGDDDRESLVAVILGEADGMTWSLDSEKSGALILEIPASETPRHFVVALSRTDQVELVAASRNRILAQSNIEVALQSTSPRWPDPVTTVAQTSDASGAFEVETIPHPELNPWLAIVRLTGLDFLSSGEMLVTAWDGDVWRVRESTRESGERVWTWKRVASGLFQPLGIKIVDDVPYVTCRDQLVVLRDRNGDGEFDHYDCFNSDHQVTEHFHEFAMGLQRDDAGNFYYAKSARHALTAVVPHHGTLLRVTPDGERTEIVATGFRAANGVCLNPDGTFIVTDQEGHWNPKNRINWVREGGFYGNMFGYHNVTDSSNEAMEQPLCWITNAFDRSPAELLWVEDASWGALHGRLLNLSYGNGKVFVVPHETVDGIRQGGMCALPIQAFPTGVMRGRFGGEGYLYLCGMFAWAGDRTQPGGFYRIRPTDRPATLPVELHATKQSLTIGLTDPVDATSASDPSRYSIKVWDLERTANYGSKHINEHELEVQSASVSDDGKTITLQVDGLSPTWGMEIRARWIDSQGNRIERVIHNSIHRLGDNEP